MTSKKRKAETAAPATTATAESVEPSNNTVPLDKLAHMVNMELEKAGNADSRAQAAGQEANDHRIAAGHLLVQARARVHKMGWTSWLSKHIKRSRSDIYRCIALVESDDPAKAREAEKAKAREGMAVTRAKNVPNVRDKALAAVNAAKPAPSKSVWDQAGGKSNAQVRDEAISVAANKLATLTSYALATEVETQLRLLTDAKWATVSDVRKAEITRLVNDLLKSINPAEIVS